MPDTLPLDTQAPFVLLDDARADGVPARLFLDAVEIIAAETESEVGPALDRLRAAARRGLHVAGYLAYEAGSAIERRLVQRAERRDGVHPLLWFGLFERVERIAPEALADLLPDPAGAWAAPPRPLARASAHAEAVRHAKTYIAAGDIYQVNLTFPAEVRFAGEPLALYARLRAAAAAGWGGIVFTGERWLLSFSPEMFFALEGGELTARPMKGTAPRGGDAASDAAAAAALAADAKERAENLMIVDLLRNDLSRVAVPGSVAVPALFEIESYPTVHQLTSTITARLAQGHDAIDVLRAAFPCGSVTGAPKIRAMQVIAELERDARNSYTGSIGYIGPSGDAAFNVAIRTLEVVDDGRAIMGLGSGIVADSREDAEWRECLAKGAFVSHGARGFDLVETMRFDAVEGIAELERHLARLKASADALGFAFNRHDTRNELQAATFRLKQAAKVRLMLSRSGRVAIETRPLPGVPDAPVEVAIVPLPVASADFRLRHKTSDRAFYDEARVAGGAFEAVFVDTQGFVTEGSFTNVFVARDDRLVTPPLARGLLPGVLRARLINEGRAVEGDVTPADLAGGFLVGNALRGLIEARPVAAPDMPGL